MRTRPITSVTFKGLPFRITLEVHICVYEEFVISGTNTSQATRAASARAFVQSLNILIKYARMYGYEHKRTEGQFETTWSELQNGLPSGGFLLGVSDNKLLLDGIPLESGQAEKSFATLLTTAGLASLHFPKEVTEEDFVRLVRAFTAAGSKSTDLAKQIKEALNAGNQNSTIKINEVKFVAADPLTGDVSIAAQIAAQTLGPEFKQWLNDPQKLLQLIAAAEGANSGGAPGATGPDGVPLVPLGSVPNAPRGHVAGGAGTGTGTGAAPAWEGGMVPLQEQEVVQAIRLLTRFGQVQQDPNVQEADIQKELTEVDPNTRLNLQQLLGSLAAQATSEAGRRYATVDEGGRAHGDSLCPGAIPEGRSQSERRSPDDGAHEPADGFAALDPEAPGRQDEQGRDIWWSRTPTSWTACSGRKFRKPARKAC